MINFWSNNTCKEEKFERQKKDLIKKIKNFNEIGEPLLKGAIFEEISIDSDGKIYGYAFFKNTPNIGIGFQIPFKVLIKWLFKFNNFDNFKYLLKNYLKDCKKNITDFEKLLNFLENKESKKLKSKEYILYDDKE